jgi:hypothetical protein
LDELSKIQPHQRAHCHQPDGALGEVLKGVDIPVQILFLDCLISFTDKPGIQTLNSFHNQEVFSTNVDKKKYADRDAPAQWMGKWINRIMASSLDSTNV